MRHDEFATDLPHYIRNADGDITHRPGWCALTDSFYGPAETFGTVKRDGRSIARPFAYVFAGLAIACFVTQLFAPGVIFAIGAGVMRWLAR